jgi:hypothetical protein
VEVDLDVSDDRVRTHAAHRLHRRRFVRRVVEDGTQDIEQLRNELALRASLPAVRATTPHPANGALGAGDMTAA